EVSPAPSLSGQNMFFSREPSAHQSNRSGEGSQLGAEAVAIVDVELVRKANARVAHVQHHASVARVLPQDALQSLDERRGEGLHRQCEAQLAPRRGPE